jgi:hypothetical protein
VKAQFLPAWLAGAWCASLVAAPAAIAQITPEAARALHAASAAKAVADAAQAAATAATPPAAEMLTAPPAPTAPPVLTFLAAPPEASSDLLGNTDGMPIASARLLASLTSEQSAAPAAPPLFSAPAAPMPVPAFIPAAAAEAAAPPLPPPAPPPAAIAAPTVLAALGAAPVRVPSAAALEAAVAAQTTPIPAPSPFYVAPVYAAPAYAAAPVARAQNAGYAPRGRRQAAQPGNARFMRAVVSTAAVSVEMPDVGRQISPLGLLLGQLVTSQETPGSQYGLAEEMAMPTRPRLMAMPEVAVPPGFCSAEQRGAFMEGVYQPALAIARHNSEVASGYVRKLRTLYDNYQLSGDTRAQGAIAAEAKDFARTANAAGSIQDELNGQFEDIMTTPVSNCGASQ